MALQAQEVMEFKLGDGCTHYFQFLTDYYSAGGALFFAAKPAVDADATDAAAVINKEFGDDDIVDSSHEMYKEGYTTYELVFTPGDITGVSFADGTSQKKFLGEFQFVPSGGDPVSYPANDNYVDVTIFADIRRATS